MAQCLIVSDSLGLSVYWQSFVTPDERIYNLEQKYCATEVYVSRSYAINTH